MSIQALNWAFQQRVGSVGLKATLVALANFADEDGTCFPGRDLVAEITDQSPRSVSRQINQLADLGVLSVERRSRDNGSRATNRYRLDLSANLSCDRSAGQSANLSRLEPPVNHHLSPDGSASADVAADGSQETPGNGERKPFTARLRQELLDGFDVELEPQDTAHEAFVALLDVALNKLPPARHHATAMGVIADYVEFAQGWQITRQSRDHTARLVRTHDPPAVLHAYGEAMNWGAGIDSRYADDPLALSKYVAGVLSKRKART